MTVTDILAASRAAHLQKMHAAGRVDRTGVVVSKPDYPKAEAHIAEALRLRLEAHAADPAHADPAWVQDQKLTGCTHDALVEFFTRYKDIP